MTSDGVGKYAYFYGIRHELCTVSLNEHAAHLEDGYRRIRVATITRRDEGGELVEQDVVIVARKGAPHDRQTV